MTGDAAPLAMPREMVWSWVGIKDYVPELSRWMASLGDTLLIGLAIQLTVFAIVGYFVTLVVWRVAVTWAWLRRSRLRSRRSRAA